MNITQRTTDRGFDLTVPVSTAFRLRDEMKVAWDEDDTFVAELTDKLGGYDDDSSEDITIVISAEVAPDLADALEVGDDEVRAIGEELQKLMDQHNEQVMSEAERATEG